MSAIETAKQHWGENMPDWIEVLALEADKSSQNKIAQKIGKSSAAISHIYPGTIENVEAAVRANLMNGSHECPVFGTILIRECLENQSRPFCGSGNPNKIRLFKACRNCKFNKRQGEQ